MSAWFVYNRIGAGAAIPLGPSVVVAGFLLLITLPPILALSGLKRTAVLFYFLPVLWLGYRSIPAVSGGDGGLLLAFLIGAGSFVLSPGARRAVRIMSARTWAAVGGIGLALCIPEVMVRLPAMQPQAVTHRSLLWPSSPEHALVMSATLTMIAALAALWLVRTLPSPIGRRLLMLLAVPAYPGATTLVTRGSGAIGPFGTVEVVYLPTLVLACLAVALIWQSRRHDQSQQTPQAPAQPGRHA
jgi:hypothetical protein